MASGTFTIPMSQYYAKSNILKSKVDQVSQDVTNNFINRVNDNLSQLDGNDQSYLENVESYITAKNLNNKLQTEHLMNLGYMSMENPNNPLYQLVERDKHYSSTFQDIADNKNTGAVTQALESIELKVSDVSAGNMLDKLLDLAGDAISSDLYKQITQLASSNPTKALKKLLDSAEFIDVIDKSKTATDFFLEIMIKLEQGSQLPKKLVETLIDSNTFVNILSKAPVKIQESVLNAMIKYSDDGWKLLNKSEKFLGWVKNLTNNSVAKTLLKGIKKGLDSTVGKVVTSPWFSVGVAGGFSAVNAYFDEGSEAYKNVGKSVVCGIIDGVASIGPIDGALIGAQIGGVPGAMIGCLAGTGIQFFQFVLPNLKNNMKDGAYKLVDDITEIGKSVGQKIDTAIDNAGKAIENGVNQIKDKASQLLDSLIPDIPKIDFGWFS